MQSGIHGHPVKLSTYPTCAYLPCSHNPMPASAGPVLRVHTVMSGTAPGRGNSWKASPGRPAAQSAEHISCCCCSCPAGLHTARVQSGRAHSHVHPNRGRRHTCQDVRMNGSRTGPGLVVQADESRQRDGVHEGPSGGGHRAPHVGLRHAE